MIEEMLLKKVFMFSSQAALGWAPAAAAVNLWWWWEMILDKTMLAVVIASSSATAHSLWRSPLRSDGAPCCCGGVY